MLFALCVKRKNYNTHDDDFKHQNTPNRNGQTFDKPICNVCGKRHSGRCTNQAALKAFYDKKNTSNRNTSTLPVCGLCNKPGHIQANCHKDPKNSAAAAEWRAKMQQKNIRNGNGNPKINGYKPNTNNNKVNNIELNKNDDKDSDFNMTDVVQHVSHNDQDDDLVDFDSE
jgi:hypothetical protein